MPEADHVRLGRIAEKIAVARADPRASRAFGADAHGFELEAPLPEAVVAGFEERHEVTLPSGYRSFVTELGGAGAGPGVGLRRLDASCCARRRSGHLARRSPYLPGPRYLDDWEQRYEDPPDPHGSFLPGTLEVAGHGCALVTRLVVTGPARGRLLNLDADGPVGPYVVEDADFLAWYERWLDEALAGCDVGWFGERLPLEEPELLAVLDEDPSPQRRARAGESLLRLPTVSDGAWTALIRATTIDADPTVRAELWDLLRWRRHRSPRHLDDAETIADGIARYARSCIPLGLRALVVLRRLTFTDVLSELACGDLERRRQAAYRLARETPREDLRQDLLDDVAAGLLDDADALLRFHGVDVVSRFGLTRLHARLRELRETEADPWVQYNLDWYLSERRPRALDEHLTSTTPEWAEEPPF
ncbi:hypothetical protein [Actinocorallia libanotica]|uniref:SMI1/KNR4 family protein SUKH-1 n=1 Tax=Actinocorallia libanotica TaxID=46162 RepID=A0ABP4B5D8_9ACTN